MKSQVRVLGIDDAPFSFDDERVEIVGVVVRLPSYVEGLMVSDVEVDGGDATQRVAEMMDRSRFRESIALTMIDGVAFGGFNVIDVRELHERVSIPVATVTKKEPDLPSMEKALKARFPDWKKRLDIIARSELQRVKTPHKPLFVYGVGISMDNLRELIRRSTVRGALPEPLRIAHLVATALKTGESKGSS